MKPARFRRAAAGIGCALLAAAQALAAIPGTSMEHPTIDVASTERERILKAADTALGLQPITITRFRARLSEGGPNDFYSNGDYWWPNPNTSNGLPYVQRDGQSNPDNFAAHRQCVTQLRDAVAALGAAYTLTVEDHYAAKAAELLRVFFLAPETRMNPSLKYAQAIPGVTPGRGIGIIDTLHLVEVPLAIRAMEHSKAFPPELLTGLRQWFRDYLEWLTTSKNGLDEAKAGNNHAVAYWLQVACFARLTGDEPKLAECRRRFKEVFVAKQMANDGSFPAELRRTKPYGYSIFQLDNMAALCQIASTPDDDLWQYAQPDGRGIRKAMEFLYPFLADKSKWPHPPDIQAWDGWPARQPSLLFAGLAFGEKRYLDLWRKLPADPTDAEVRRNIAITQPLLWIQPTSAAESDAEKGKADSLRVFLLNAKHLQNTRQRIREGDKSFTPALEALQREADRALEYAPVSVVTKATTPPSGDKHDYMSLAPYFWPNPNSSNGLPYVRRDGERNPEIGKVTDHKNILEMPEKTETLALAWYFTGQERYAAKAAELIRVWFLAPATRMNPNLQYAQAVSGVNTGRGTGLIESRGLIKIVDAVGLLAGSPAWTEADQQGVEAWFAEFLRWMQDSRIGQAEAAAKNNHGTFYDAQVISFALFLGKNELAKQIAQTARQKRIAVQIEPDGRQPLELARTKAWSYSLGNLSGLMTLAELSDNVGVDLWNYETPDGRSIAKALDFLLPFALRQKEWSYQQLGGWSPEGFFPLLRRAALKIPASRFREVAAERARVKPTDRICLLEPSLPELPTTRTP